MIGLWAVERGTLWAMDAGDRVPPVCQARAPAEFGEATTADAERLAAAMGLPDTGAVLARLRGGRRCFWLQVDGQIACYGWVTRGAEEVGELERLFHLRDDEAYIWDCATLPEWRGRRCYSALLSQIAHRMRDEQVARCWIGASRQNQPSIRAFGNAGFVPVVDVLYRRLWRLTLMRIYHAPRAPPSLLGHAYRILCDANERRVGHLLVGFRR
jgi:ribosomal protein S18 acetylase RimI-like enzyme